MSRSEPGCVVILLDRSDSMKLAWGRTGASLAVGAALAVNNILLDMCIKATTEVNAPVRHYFDVGIFSYGARVNTPGEGVESAFGGVLAGRGLVPLPELAEHPMAVREEPSIDLMPVSARMPVWVDPVHGYRTPMCQAIEVAGAHVFDWAAGHPNSFPPIVINITDGMVTDSPHDGASLHDWVKRLTSIETNDGATLFFNIFLSPFEVAEIVFPSDPTGLPAPGPDLFELSSPLPQPMIDNARVDGYDVQPGARGLALNVGRSTLLRVLQIGTRVPDRPR
ncbi:vWA domain-containing protein [Saccharothrix deserti]|uniref:vWA domain-containing protein n=1 Tax=Saccharothrix deserti TaxID=2593674 RepID=UPI00192E418C|nr:vWA domain-containing protein [Saccharothrix deserti]